MSVVKMRDLTAAFVSNLDQDLVHYFRINFQVHLGQKANFVSRTLLRMLRNLVDIEPIPEERELGDRLTGALRQ
jgi:hypothetical protein